MICALFFSLFQQSTPIEVDAATRARILQHSPLPAPQADPTNRVADDPDAMRLGWALFYDTRFSKDGSVSCATCHDPSKAFSDGRTISRGMSDGNRNTPSLYNVAQQRWLFWDGRADSTWAQALQPMEMAHEMSGSRASIVATIAGDEILKTNYERVFGAIALEPGEALDRIYANLGKSIAAFERKLVSNNSEFDRYVRALREQGVTAAPSAKRDPSANDALANSDYPLAARRGLALFVGRANCRLCHSGPLFSDGEFHDIGVPNPLDALRPDPMRRRGLDLLAQDPFRASGIFSDAPDGEKARELSRLVVSSESYGQVRTPSLRNVARTAPYMHAGQLATLSDVMHFYSTRAGARASGHHQETILKPLHLSDDEVADLIAFLETLTDESLPDVYKRAPAKSALSR